MMSLFRRTLCTQAPGLMAISKGIRGIVSDNLSGCNSWPSQCRDRGISVDRPPVTQDSDRTRPATPSGSSNGVSEQGIRSSLNDNPGWVGRRSALVIVVFAVLVPSSIAAWRWFLWTRTDAYQFQRVDAEATALIHEWQGWDGTDRWIALTALARDPFEASIRAGEISNPFYRIQTLSLLTATVAKAGAETDAETAGRQLSEVARLLEDSSSSAQDPEQSIRLLEAIAMATSRAGLAVPARAVAFRARDQVLQITEVSAIEDVGLSLPEARRVGALRPRPGDRDSDRRPRDAI